MNNNIFEFKFHHFNVLWWYQIQFNKIIYYFQLAFILIVLYDLLKISSVVNKEKISYSKVLQQIQKKERKKKTFLGIFLDSWSKYLLKHIYSNILISIQSLFFFITFTTKYRTIGKVNVFSCFSFSPNLSLSNTIFFSITLPADKVLLS